ncbi:MAG: polysaccharide deacetylase family protein [Armatimonadota bacterium]
MKHGEKRRGLKGLAQRAAYALGVPAVAGTAAHDWHGGGRLEIFFGHHVLADDAPGEDLRSGDLYDRLMYLRRTRDLVSLSEAVAWLRRPGRGERLAALTFDDGYRDNLHHLLPVLQAAKAPATVFVATQAVIEGGHIWFDELRCALGRAGAVPLEVAWLPDSLRSQKLSQADRTAAIVGMLQETTASLRDQRLRELLASLPAECLTVEPRYQVLTAEELQTLAADPLVTIGAHTHSHTVMSVCTDAVAEDEVTSNVAALTELLGDAPRFLAYPRGRSGDYCARDKALLQRLGFEAAVTTVARQNTYQDEPLALGRLPLGHGGVERFAWAIDVHSHSRRRDYPNTTD